jgi:hypothetical protein
MCLTLAEQRGGDLEVSRVARIVALGHVLAASRNAVAQAQLDLRKALDARCRVRYNTRVDVSFCRGYLGVGIVAYASSMAQCPTCSSPRCTGSLRGYLGSCRWPRTTRTAAPSSEPRTLGPAQKGGVSDPGPMSSLY